MEDDSGLSCGELVTRNGPQQEVGWEGDVFLGWGKKGSIEETKTEQRRELWQWRPIPHDS